MDFASSNMAAENRTRWKGSGVHSSVVPQRPSNNRDRIENRMENNMSNSGNRTRNAVRQHLHKNVGRKPLRN